MGSDWFKTEDGDVKPIVRYGIIVVAVAVLGFLAYRAWFGGEGARSIALACTTEGCGYTREKKPEIGEMLPLICPECGKRSVVPAFRCRNCGTLNAWNESKGLTPPTPCVKCGQERFHHE